MFKEKYETDSGEYKKIYLFNNFYSRKERERVRGEETRQTISVDLHYYVDLITISLRNSRKIWFSPSIQLNSTQGT